MDLFRKEFEEFLGSLENPKFYSMEEFNKAKELAWKAWCQAIKIINEKIDDRKGISLRYF